MESDVEPNVEMQSVLSLRRAMMIYLGACMLMALSYKGLSAINHAGWSIWIYLLIGVALNHLLLKKLIEWHPMYNTLDNVVNAKLKAVLFWPLSYLVLLISLLLNRAL